LAGLPALPHRFFGNLTGGKKMEDDRNGCFLQPLKRSTEGGEIVKRSFPRPKDQKMVVRGLRRACLSGLLALLFLLQPRFIQGQTSTQHYDVGGANLREVKDNIFGPNGSGPNGRAGSASLSYTYNYQYNCVQEGDSCIVTITGVTVNLACTILLPNWTGYNQASPEDQQEWDRFMEALTTHEQGHCDRYLTQANKDAVQAAAAAALVGNSVTIPCPNGCQPGDPAFGEALGTAVDNLLNSNQGFQDVFNGMEQEQDNYDNTTHHGETQGATLHDP